LGLAAVLRAQAGDLRDERREQTIRAVRRLGGEHLAVELLPDLKHRRLLAIAAHYHIGVQIAGVALLGGVGRLGEQYQDRRLSLVAHCFQCVDRLLFHG
jgi:hypothetical protein